ncbi:MAG: hypothetical protein P8I82_06010 [Flavobacteriales bacterium]|nr:hypothetical protein [Flavobacteriales bacterium]
MRKLFLIISVCLSLNCFSQIQYSSDNTEDYASIKNLSGPRIGITYVTSGELTRNLKKELGVNSQMVSQFGYQFEKQVMGDDQIAGLVEGILFVGGLEYGLFLPSLSGMFGARFSSGYEFAVGPNLSLSGATLVIGAGRTLDLGNLYIPINIAWVPSVGKERTVEHFKNGIRETDYEKYQTGHRFTLTVGFNFNKR